MFNRSLAIELLEKQDDTWLYEDMSDNELLYRLASTVPCSDKKKDLITNCKELTCEACWKIILGEVDNNFNCKN